ncbi:hypothetical protein Ssi03_13260 [Sphaerisporangium siamense]|uniref:Uncharacterized protein n=1 Tax=Sphaerisporangium siamense TaxID=795645 RepID=A0A7W7DC23_9ACTN|nr:hypothetical protein [Sphaerisporangium siamense]MBB4702906.1 hypothetical protein [Sphaerisporangium siamense]GII83336.1 hypothetical protein Ssi03_13260 [Sphaerisporangium siamense]
MSNCPTCGQDVLDPEPAEGTVLIDRDDDAWQHREGLGWYCVERGTDLEKVTWKSLNEEYGPLRVVYRP